MWRGSTGVKRCGVALTSATTPAPFRNLSPSWVVSLSVATSFNTTSVGGTVSRYICVSLWLLLVTEKIQVLVLDYSGLTSLQFGLETFLDRTRSMCSICNVVFCLFHINNTSYQPQKKKITDVTATVG